jgi:hypothetical protein
MDAPTNNEMENSIRYGGLGKNDKPTKIYIVIKRCSNMNLGNVEINLPIPDPRGFNY